LYRVRARRPLRAADNPGRAVTGVTVPGGPPPDRGRRSCWRPSG